MSWVYSVPVWVASIIIIGGTCALAATGILIVRARSTRMSQIAHNDVAGPIMTTVGTLLAVLLSFMVVTVWQAYDAASHVVDMEASEVADLYHVAGAMPEPIRDRIRTKLQTYVTIVVHDG